MTFATAKTAQDVLNIIESSAHSDALILFDVDDTIITPSSKAFRSSQYKYMIDEIKSHAAEYANYDEIISNWRLQRKVMLTDSMWPHVINTLKQKHTVYALTKMDSGAIGNIPSIEEWRFQELTNLGISFSRNDDMQSLKHHGNGPSFYNGILCTGKSSKSAAIDAFSSVLHYKAVVFVDDRIGYLQDIHSYCIEHGIDFLGIHFIAVEQMEDNANPLVAEYQKQYLISHGQWLEDDVAESMMHKHNSVGEI